MFEELDKLIEDTLEENKEFSKVVTLERAEKEVVTYMKQLLAEKYNCSEEDALLHWDEFKSEEGVKICSI